MALYYDVRLSAFSFSGKSFWSTFLQRRDWNCHFWGEPSYWKWHAIIML